MFNLTFENERGDTLALSTASDLTTPYAIVDIDGLNPPKATINTSQLALMDGAQFNSAKLEMRTINVAFVIQDDVASNRVNIYKVLKTKHPIKVSYQSETRDVFISGYVESIEVEYTGNPQQISVAILCPYPYWQAAQSMVDDLSSVIGMFHFAFASTETPEIVMGYIDPLVSIEIENGGDIETGIVIELDASEAVENPRIIDYETGDYIQLDMTLLPGDLVTIDTRVGHKTATLLRAGVVSSVFNAVAKGSTWLQLAIGSSTYTYTAQGGAATGLSVKITHTSIYEGV